MASPALVAADVSLPALRIASTNTAAKPRCAWGWVVGVCGLGVAGTVWVSPAAAFASPAWPLVLALASPVA